MPDPAEIVARLRRRRTALWRHAAQLPEPAQALVARQVQALDSQIAVYEQAACRLAELEELTARLSGQAILAGRLAAEGVDLAHIFGELRRIALAGQPWPEHAHAVLGRLRDELGLAAGCVESAWVAHVIDGDSIRLEDGREVRYIGIDAPEMADVYGQPEPFALEARDANARLVAGKQVRLEREVSDCDRHGRLLRHVYTGPTWVSGELLRLGVVTVRPIEPDVREADRLKALQHEAQLAGRGIWAG